MLYVRLIREKGLICYGCGNGGKRKASLNCSIYRCKYKNNFCFECVKFPCQRLKQLDKRYRNKYQMSMLENLEYIKVKGLDAFIKYQDKKYRCNNCGKLKTVHLDYCIYCKKSNDRR